MLAGAQGKAQRTDPVITRHTLLHKFIYEVNKLQLEYETDSLYDHFGQLSEGRLVVSEEAFRKLAWKRKTTKSALRYFSRLRLIADTYNTSHAEAYQQEIELRTKRARGYEAVMVFALENAGDTTLTGHTLDVQGAIRVRVCAACCKRETDTTPHKRCARCRAVFYCSVLCQRNDWKVHKEHCRQLVVAKPN